MYAGQVVERAPIDELFATPRHPYTRALLDSMPKLIGEHRGDRLREIPGMTPALLNLPPGCAFRTRCPRAAPACAQLPELEPRNGRLVRCFYPL